MWLFVIFRSLEGDKLVTKKLITKTNSLPRWAERVRNIFYFTLVTKFSIMGYAITQVIWTAKNIDQYCSQLQIHTLDAILAVLNNTKLFEIRPEEKFRPVRDLNPWPLWYWCSALPTELTSQMGAGHYVGSK